METIKIAVEVNVNLSESTQNFIKGLIGTPVHGEVLTAEEAPAKDDKPKATRSRAKAKKEEAPVEAPKAEETPVDEAQVEESPAAEPAKAEEAPAIGIEDVRKALQAKVGSHRSEIKAKLEELGAPSVTKLDPDSYKDMLDYLNSL